MLYVVAFIQIAIILLHADIQSDFKYYVERMLDLGFTLPWRMFCGRPCKGKAMICISVCCGAVCVVVCS